MDKYIEKLLNILDNEINETKLDLNQVEEQFGKPVVVENKEAEAYLLLLDNIKAYINKSTKDGIYNPVDYKEVNKTLMKLHDFMDEQLGTKDWRKYIRIFWYSAQKRYATQSTTYGKKIWRTKDENGERIPEGKLASDFWHKMQIYIYEYCKANKINSTNVTIPTTLDTK